MAQPPKSRSVYRSIAVDQRAPIATRLAALAQIESPSRNLLVTLTRHNQPARLRHAAAQLLEQMEVVKELMRDAS